MRKLIILAFLLIVGIVPVLAKTPDELTQLAQYFPSDTVGFVSMRVDEDFIATLDQLIVHLAAKLPDSNLPSDTPLLSLLDETASRYDENGDFSSVYRSWMGDTVALAYPDYNMVNGSQPLAYYVVEVTDMDAAKAWLAIETSPEMSPYDEYVVFEEPEGIYYITDYLWEPKYLLKDDVLISVQGYGTEDGIAIDLLNLQFETSLADNPEFQNALTVLPEDDYSIFFYADLATVLEPMLAFAPMALGAGAQDMNFADALSGMGPQVGGLTILDNRALTIDFAQIMEADMSFGDTPAADLDFAKYVPSDAALVMHDQNMAEDSLYLLGLVQGFAKIGDAQIDKMSTSSQAGFAVMPPSRIIQFQLNAFKGMSGLSLEDFLGWMGSDYVNYIRILPDEALMFSFDSATVIKNTDADGARATYTASKKLLDALSIPYSEDGNLLSLSIFNDFLQKNAGMMSDTLEMQLGFNDEVFALGSLPGVSFALNPTDDSLASDSTFQAASAYFLPDTQIVWYINFAPLTDFANLLAEEVRDMEQVALISGLFDSASLTVHYGEDAVGHVRAVLSLAD